MWRRVGVRLEFEPRVFHAWREWLTNTRKLCRDQPWRVPSTNGKPAVESQTLTTHARVVIVGGGILGCSLAYHLAREGWSDCVLLEKAELTSGSTWHAAGQVTYSTSSYGLGRMAGYAIELYTEVPERR